LDDVVVDGLDDVVVDGLTLLADLHDSTWGVSNKTRIKMDDNKNFMMALVVESLAHL
jgi:hypothetical protein